MPAAAELGTAIRSGSLLGKGSPLSGAGCVDRDLLCDVQDDRRPGTELRVVRRVVRRTTEVSMFDVVTLP